MARQYREPKLNLDRSIPEVLQTQIAGEATYLIGNPIDGLLKVASGSLKGMVYIHLGGDNPDAVTYAHNDAGVKLKFGKPVKVKRGSDNHYHIVRLAPENTAYENEATQTSLEPILRDQMISGGLYPTGAGYLAYKGTVYRINEDVYLTLDKDTADLLTGTVQDTSMANITVPTSNGQAKTVLVQINPSTDTFSYKQSSEYNAGLSWRQLFSNGDVPNPDIDHALVGYARLIAGQTSIELEHILNAPDVFTNRTSISLGSDDIANESGVAGDNVSEALDALSSSIGSFGSDDIANDSFVTGVTVSDALETLQSIIPSGTGGLTKIWLEGISSTDFGASEDPIVFTSTRITDTNYWTAGDGDRIYLYNASKTYTVKAQLSYESAAGDREVSFELKRFDSGGTLQEAYNPTYDHPSYSSTLGYGLSTINLSWLIVSYTAGDFVRLYRYETTYDTSPEITLNGATSQTHMLLIEE